MMRSRRRPSFTTVMLVLGLLFLYLPMMVLVVYSFNESRLVTVWAGFSTQWYGELFRDQQILSAVWTSLEIAFFAASMAVCLGTVAAGTPSQEEVRTSLMVDRQIPIGNYILQVNGRSMEPKIPDGSYIEVSDFRGQGFPKKGSIVVYADGTGATLKKFTPKRDGKGHRAGVLTSINPDYPEVDPLEGGEIQALFVRVLK